MAVRRVVGWKLDAADRAGLLRRFQPRFPDVDADHVTLAAGAPMDAPLPAPPVADVVGRADDGRGLEALVVRLDGTVDRPDGGVYHITWSLDRAAGRQPRESNDLLRGRVWEPLAEPIPIRLDPAEWRSGG